MKSENYTKALDDLNFARESMQAQLKIATVYEGVLILQVLRQIAEIQYMCSHACSMHQDRKIAC